MQLLSITLLLISCVTALTSGNLQERQDGNIVITTGASGGVFPRYEIQQLKDEHGDQWTLFILALSQMQSAPQSSPVSWYGIANIHGLPLDDYNGVAKCQTCEAAGYGAHNSVLFLPWHRIYVSHLEQEMIKVAKSIAESYPEAQRQNMLDAANELRMPYWDWVGPRLGPVLPMLVTEPMVSVSGPTGVQSIENPLFSYEFTNSSGLGEHSMWNRTYRWPSNTSPTPESRTQEMQNALAANRPGFQDLVYGFFTLCSDYLHFSNNFEQSDEFPCIGLEGIHNNVHGLVGGASFVGTMAGHMTDLMVSAYDPVFWLHHSNVDRLFAMWQRIHDNYVVDHVAETASWTIAGGSVQGASSPLTPFYKDISGNFWTSNDIRDWNVLGYTYPEFVNSDGSSSSISRFVNDLYGPNAGIPGVVPWEAGPPRLRSTLSPASPLVASNGSLFQYTAYIDGPRHYFGSSYTIFVFDGNPASEDLER